LFKCGKVEAFSPTTAEIQYDHQLIAKAILFKQKIERNMALSTEEKKSDNTLGSSLSK